MAPKRVLRNHAGKQCLKCRDVDILETPPSFRVRTAEHARLHLQMRLCFLEQYKVTLTETLEMRKDP